MRHDTPRGIQFIRAAIARVADVGELARLREFAREQWADDPEFYVELEALLDHREAELEGRPGSQLPLPLDSDDDTDTYEGLDRDAG